MRTVLTEAMVYVEVQAIPRICVSTMIRDIKRSMHALRYQQLLSKLSKDTFAFFERLKTNVCYWIMSGTRRVPYTHYCDEGVVYAMSLS